MAAKLLGVRRLAAAFDHQPVSNHAPTDRGASKSAYPSASYYAPLRTSPPQPKIAQVPEMKSSL